MNIKTKNKSFSALLLDRDGTIIVDKHYLSDPHAVELFPGIGRVLKKFYEAGKKAYLVSNQSGIGRGFFPYEEAVACNNKTLELLQKEGGDLEDMLFCPHAPEDNCSCRKPAVGMWDELQKKYFLDAGKTLMVGDKVDDLLFSKNAGLKASVLVMTGKGQETAKRLGLSLQGKGYQLYPDEERPEYPNILISDSALLYDAVLELESLIF